MTKDEAFEALEEALLNYMIASEEEDGQDASGMMIEGWVAQVSARTIAGVDNKFTSTQWLGGQTQSRAATVGLARMLSLSVDGWAMSNDSMFDDDE